MTVRDFKFSFEVGFTVNKYSSFFLLSIHNFQVDRAEQTV